MEEKSYSWQWHGESEHAEADDGASMAYWHVALSGLVLKNKTKRKELGRHGIFSSLASNPASSSLSSLV
jgi:hypothetical protein